MAAECINLPVKYITEGNPALKRNKNELKRLFEFATKETHFLFNGAFYIQVDGVAMGSPLAPVLANLLYLKSIRNINCMDLLGNS